MSIFDQIARAAEALKGCWKPQDAPQAPNSPSRALVNPRGLPGRHGATQHHWRVIKGHRWWFAVGPGRISAFTTQQHAMAYADREARKS